MAKSYQKKQDTKQKAQNIRKVLLGVFIAILFFGSMYGYRCLIEKVCEHEVIDRMVRHDMTVLMPKGALHVEVVDTQPSRALGLSGRGELESNEGMLFIFDYPGKYGFWMKDMNFPLDIVWVNQNGIVVHIERNLTPESYPKAFINDVDANYVIEMKAGSSDLLGLFLGSKVKFAE